MKEYQELIKNVFENGYVTKDRTGTGTIAVFGTQMRMKSNFWHFPVLTTKKMAFNSILGEALWFLRGSTNVNELREITYGNEERRTIWDLNYENQAVAMGYIGGELGPIYGHQWRNFGGDENQKGVDQLYNVIETIKNNPIDRRIIVSAWNPLQIDKMTLPPCHMMFQFNVHDGIVDLMWYQRSVDVFLGLPYNITSYAIILEIVAACCGLGTGDLIFTGGNTHIYLNHVEQCKEILSRTPMELPELSIPVIPNVSTSEQLKFIEQLQVSDFKLEYYKSHPSIKGTMSV